MKTTPSFTASALTRQQSCHVLCFLPRRSRAFHAKRVSRIQDAYKLPSRRER